MALFALLVAGCASVPHGAAPTPRPRIEGVLDLPATPVAHWNTLLVSFFASEQTPPPVAARELALLNGAMYAGYFEAGAEREDERLLALNEAARIMMRSLHRKYDQRADHSFQTLTELLPDQPAIKDAAKTLAQQVFAARVNDGAQQHRTFRPTGEAGHWAPTEPYFEDGLLYIWKDLPPMVLASAAQFRPPVPPEINTATFADERAEVQKYGRYETEDRTEYQTESAYFWADGKGTHTPPGTWTRIALDQAQATQMPEAQQLEMMYVLSLALFDASVSTWDAKYYYDYWRPIQAIRAEGNTEWQSLIEAPNFPEYPSGHSVFSGAAATVLAYYFPIIQPFEVQTLGSRVGARTYQAFEEIADEAAMSRLYGGIHFKSAIVEGVRQGENIAEYVIKNWKNVQMLER